jgi:hypothetical protein
MSEEIKNERYGLGGCLPPDEKCEHCAYWRPVDGFKSGNCCHYMLDTGKRRARDEEGCKSFSTKRVVIPAFFDPMSNDRLRAIMKEVKR